jgi:transposase
MPSPSAAPLKDDPVIELIRTIPGAGLITATTIRAYVDDIARFDSPKQLAAYAGLTPWVQNSANRQRHGRIAKRGPNELRTALVQVVLGMVRNKRRTGAYRIMERYSRMTSHKGSGRTIVATARKLSEIIWHVLSENQPFDETKMKDPNIRRKAMEMEAAAFDVA